MRAREPRPEERADIQAEHAEARSEMQGIIEESQPRALCPYCGKVEVDYSDTLCEGCKKELREEGERVAAMTDKEFKQEQAARAEEMIDYENNQERLMNAWLGKDDMERENALEHSCADPECWCKRKVKA